MAIARVLIVDDEESMCILMTQILKRNGQYEPVTVSGAEEAMARLNEERFDVLVTDLMMPGMSGEQLIETVRLTNPSLPVIVVTSHGTIESAVDLTRKGAFHYIQKPFKASEFLLHIDRAVENVGLKREVAALRDRVGQADALKQIVGNSRAIGQVLEVIPSIARNEASVVIYGESGTGKELIARAIHELSPRAKGPFVTLNCGALPETLLENELFGHVKGAYTDAGRDQAGLAKEADQGSLFLDEVGEIGLTMQVKLLRFLQEHEYRPLGSTKTMKSNVRIIAATNRDLREAIRSGTFREDLYYRLNIIPIHLPPLRARREDIPILANHFLRKYATLFGKKLDRFSPPALQKLMGYRWPGNIRELENKIQQVLVIAPDGPVSADQIVFDEPLAADESALVHPAEPSGPMDPELLTLPLGEAKARLLTRFERHYLAETLSASKGNVSQAAQRAGKHRRAFYELMERYGLEPGPFRKAASGADAPAGEPSRRKNDDES